MKRLCGLLVLMLVSSSAYAGTISFSVGGHRVRIEAPRGCSSSSCASISIPGVYESRKKSDDDTRDVAASPPPPPPAPAAPPAQAAPPPPPPVVPAPPPVQQTVPPASRPVIASAPQPAPPAVGFATAPQPTQVAVYKPAAVATQEVAPPLPPLPQPQAATVVTPNCTTPPAATPDDAARQTPATSLPPLKVRHEEDAGDSPLGDWQTEGRGMVRIAECGRALCGYAIKEGDTENGEAILINMKEKSDLKWSGSVYSKNSGDTYYGTMRLRGSNTLHVEACAFSRFYCNGNNWTRVSKSERMITSRQVTQEPRS